MHRRLGTSVTDLPQGRSLASLARRSAQRVFDTLAGPGLIWQIAAVCVSFAVVKISAVLLGPSVVGRIALILGIAGFLSQISYGPLGVYVQKHVSRMGRPRHGIMAIHGMVVTIAVFCGGLALLATSGWVGLVGNSMAESMLPAVLVGLAMAASNIEANAAIGLGDAGRAARMTLVENCVRGGLLAFAGVYGGGSIMAMAVAAYVVSNLVVAVSAMRPMRTATGDRGDEPFRLRAVLIYVLPMCVWGVFTGMQVYIDRVLVDVHVGTEALGAYFICFALSTYPVAQLGFVASQMTAAKWFPARAQADARAADGVACCLAVLIALFALALEWMGEWTVHLLASPAFDRFAACMPLMAIAAGLQAIGNVFQTHGMVHESGTLSLAGYKIVHAVITSLLMYVGITNAGVWGLTLGMVAGQGIYLLFMIRYSRRSLASAKSRPTGAESAE